MYVQFCIKIVGLNGSYSANNLKNNQSENDDVPKLPKSLGLLLLLFEFNNFSIIKDITYNIIYT